MPTRHPLRAAPGVAAALLFIGVTTAAAVSGTASFFYEAWGQPWPRMLKYFVPTAVLMAAGILAFRWPRAGSALLLALGMGAGGYWLRRQLGRGLAPPNVLVLQAVVMTAPVLLAALLLLFEARHRRLLREAGAEPWRGWAARNWRPMLLVVLPIAGALLLASQQLPALLARHDDGLRTARTIDSGGITLVWAPPGPGWNQPEPDGRLPGWTALLRHGRLAQERCAYLDDQGTTLFDTPTRRWRMPTVYEIIGALSRGGVSAGCTWDGRSPHATCRIAPDKETPLWAPDQAPIYYWSGQEASAGMAFAVNYTGGISVLPTSSSGLGVGYRCVTPAAGGR